MYSSGLGYTHTTRRWQGLTHLTSPGRQTNIFTATHPFFTMMTMAPRSRMRTTRPPAQAPRIRPMSSACWETSRARFESLQAAAQEGRGGDGSCTDASSCSGLTSINHCRTHLNNYHKQTQLLARRRAASTGLNTLLWLEQSFLTNSWHKTTRIYCSYKTNRAFIQATKKKMFSLLHPVEVFMKPCGLFGFYLSRYICAKDLCLHPSEMGMKRVVCGAHTCSHKTEIQHCYSWRGKNRASPQGGFYSCS